MSHKSVLKLCQFTQYNWYSVELNHLKLLRPRTEIIRGTLNEFRRMFGFCDMMTTRHIWQRDCMWYFPVALLCPLLYVIFPFLFHIICCYIYFLVVSVCLMLYVISPFFASYCLLLYMCLCEFTSSTIICNIFFNFTLPAVVCNMSSQLYIACCCM